ncbi:MAG: transglutaminase-like domain-containing protein [Planctomycetaceae bacterium]|nr:transglutaminase-like domain-containing protein [Planctomycetaceae bacterium]
MPRGHQQVAAITQHLRTKYRIDPAARPPDDVMCPVAHFLFDSHQGPDYQFATAAALLLRSLDYSTRLVGGFYASPERYDAKKQHTPVVAADTHVWVEVHLSGHQWLTVEPTPGYEVLGPPPELTERVWMAAVTVAGWVYAQAWPLAIVAGFLFTGWWWRHAIILFTVWVWWTYFPAHQPRQRILQTIWLLDLQGRLRGAPRPPGCPPGRWLYHWLHTRDISSITLTELSRLADWACFAPENVTVPIRDWTAVCRNVVVASRKSGRSVAIQHSSHDIPNHLPVVALTVGRITPS